MAKRWYVLHVFSGSEKKVAQSIREQAATHGLEDLVEDVMVPTENVVEVKRGVRVEGERKFFPGYILVKLELSDEAWQMVTSQPRVTGFLGGKGRPIPITDKEAERLIRQVSEGVERPRTTITFDIGEQVRVADGPFASFKESGRSCTFTLVQNGNRPDQWRNCLSIVAQANQNGLNIRPQIATRPIGFVQSISKKYSVNSIFL